MKNKRKRMRSIAISRAASLKGARAKERMTIARGSRIMTVVDQDGRPMTAGELRTGVEYSINMNTGVISMPKRTIDLIPKVRWP